MARLTGGGRIALAIAFVGVAFGAASRAAGAQQTVVRGVVFSDVNGNGVRDASERGLRGVAVSNQETVVVTDSAGAFQLPMSQWGIVSVSVPSGYKSVGAFWRNAASSNAPLAFALRAEDQPSTFTFVDASDPHTGRRRSIAFAAFAPWSTRCIRRSHSSPAIWCTTR